MSQFGQSGGGSAFFKNVPKVGGGEGSTLIGILSKIFSIFYFDVSPKLLLRCIQVASELELSCIEAAHKVAHKVAHKLHKKLHISCFQVVSNLNCILSTSTLYLLI